MNQITEGLKEEVTLPDGSKFTKIMYPPKVSNIVTVAYLKEKIINTASVFKYIPVKHVPEADGQRFKKDIPTFGHLDCILSARYAKEGRGLRIAKKQMEQICSIDVSLDDPDPAMVKSVHCKLAGDTCHVTGAKSFEQGMRATDIIIKSVENTQKLIDEYRLTPESKRSNEVFYKLYEGERTREEVDKLCLDMLSDDFEMLCKKSIKMRDTITANGVYEIKVNFKPFLKTLCDVAHFQEKFCVDYANWNRSTISSIGMLEVVKGRRFYHRAQANSKGTIRLSSPCDSEIAKEGYYKLGRLLFKTWDETQLIFQRKFPEIIEEERLERPSIEAEFEEFWSPFSESSCLEVSSSINDMPTYLRAKAVYSRLGIEI